MNIEITAARGTMNGTRVIKLQITRPSPTQLGGWWRQLCASSRPKKMHSPGRIALWCGWVFLISQLLSLFSLTHPGPSGLGLSGISGPIGAGLCEKLDTNFGEFPFHELG
jgi:hypothetical protein